jgi:hypothetical protein
MMSGVAAWPPDIESFADETGQLWWRRLAVGCCFTKISPVQSQHRCQGQPARCPFATSTRTMGFPYLQFWKPRLFPGKNGGHPTGFFLAMPPRPLSGSGSVPLTARTGGMHRHCHGVLRHAGASGRMSLDSSNCPGGGDSFFDLALRGERVENPRVYPSDRPRVCPRGAAAGGIVPAPEAAAVATSKVAPTQ